MNSHYIAASTIATGLPWSFFASAIELTMILPVACETTGYDMNESFAPVIVSLYHALSALCISLKPDCV